VQAPADRTVAAGDPGKGDEAEDRTAVLVFQCDTEDVSVCVPFAEPLQKALVEAGFKVAEEIGNPYSTTADLAARYQVTYVMRVTVSAQYLGETKYGELIASATARLEVLDGVSGEVLCVVGGEEAKDGGNTQGDAVKAAMRRAVEELAKEIGYGALKL
jgi:hypothetical protein